MLVITRRIGEAIRIGDVVIFVSKINGKQAKLAIDGPRDIHVHREEVYQARLRMENEHINSKREDSTEE